MGTSLRPRTLVQHPRRPSGLASVLLSQSRQTRDRLRPPQQKEAMPLHNIRKLLAKTIRQHRHLSRKNNSPVVSTTCPGATRMKSGAAYGTRICHHYDNGVRQVRDFQKIWDAAEKYMMRNASMKYSPRLKVQARDAV